MERERQLIERRVKQARFPAVKSLDSFDFTAVPSLDKNLVLELARCEFVARQENVIAIGDNGTGKTHIAIALGLAACQKGLSVGFTTAASLMHELLEARDEQRLLRLQRRLASYKLLIIDDLAYVPLSAAGAELLFEVVSERYERGSTIITSDLPFEEWINVFGTARLTDAVLDRLTHHAHILQHAGRKLSDAGRASGPSRSVAATGPGAGGRQNRTACAALRSSRRLPRSPIRDAEPFSRR